MTQMDPWYLLAILIYVGADYLRGIADIVRALRTDRSRKQRISKGKR